MHPPAHSAPVSWDNYAALQAIAEQRQRLDYKSWALEEQMDLLIDSLANGREVNPSDHSVRRLKNLATNRAKKYRHRDRLLQQEYVPTCPLFIECKKLDCLCNEESIALARIQVTAVEWTTFQEIADGDDYETIAYRQQLTVPVLKSRIFRCRERLRAIA